MDSFESPMLHAKFQDHRTLGSGEDFVFSSPEPSGSQGELIVYPWSLLLSSSLLSSLSTMFKHLLL